MKQFSQILFVIAFTALVFSCTKPRRHTVLPTPPSITHSYISGILYDSMGNTLPVYWQDSSMIYLSTNMLGYAKAISVSGTDVYVAGQLNPDSIAKPVIWKNTVPTFLSDSAGMVTDIYVTGQNIYASGYVIYLGITYPVMWVNGSMSFLSANEGSANSIAVSGTDIFVAGNMLDSLTMSKTVPALWMNGILYYSNQISGNINSVFVSGADLYIAGQMDQGIGMNAFVMKNSIETVLSLYGGSANHVFADSGNVFVSGNAFASTQSSFYNPILWKNGAGSYYANSSIFGEVTAATKSGKVVYAVGFGDTFGVPKLWTNGEEYNLSPMFGKATDIVVK